MQASCIDHLPTDWGIEMWAKRTTSAATLTTAAVLAFSGLSPATAAAHSAGSATAKGRVPTVVAHMSKSAIHLSVGHTVHAGRVQFHVVSSEGGHTLQVLRLHKGYTLRQAKADINKAFGGDLDAIRRVDHRIGWMGGAPARVDHPGDFSINLPRGDLILIDQNNPTFFRLHVFGKTPARPRVPTTSSITAFTYGFGTSPSTLPSSGWTRVGNVSDQPHFVVMQRVKDGTTPKMVRKFLKRHGLQGNPPWALKASTSTGVISPNHHQALRYDLPAGKYLLACFWPDDETGMPHILMGMWTLVRLA
jgi:hypothetical protein